jgi:hypothetical protein
MNQRRLFIAVIVLTMAAWGCWQGMELVPDYSPVETALFVAGYVACALALIAFYKAMRSPKT